MTSTQTLRLIEETKRKFPVTIEVQFLNGIRSLLRAKKALKKDRVEEENMGRRRRRQFGKRLMRTKVSPFKN